MGVFNTKKVDEKLIREYYERNERKKQDEAWLKSKATIIREALKNTPKSVYGDLVVTISIPNTSKFNTDKLMEYLETKIKPVDEDLFNACTKRVINEDQLSVYIENGQIDLNELQEYAWEESTGTPRVKVSKMEQKND